MPENFDSIEWITTAEAAELPGWGFFFGVTPEWNVVCYVCYSTLPGGFDATGGSQSRDGHAAEAAELAE